MKIKNRVWVTVLISGLLYYFYLYNFISVSISKSSDIHMILFVIVTYYIYLAICLILERRLSERDTYAFSFLYIIFLITLFYSKDVESATYVNTFNLDVRSYVYSINSTVGILFIIMNVVLIIPLGWMLRKLDIVIKFVLPLLIFLTTEYTQYIFGVGIFDINDIILNTLGFYIGAIVLNKLFGEIKRNHK